MRIIRRTFEGGGMNGKELLVRSDITVCIYQGERYVLIGDVFKYKKATG